MTAERADVRWRRLSHLVWRGWSSLELSWLGLRLQKSCWTLSRLIQERAATVGTGPHPGWGSREEVQLFGLLLLWLLKSHRTELCLDCTVCSCNPNRLLMKALCKSNFRIMTLAWYLSSITSQKSTEHCPMKNYCCPVSNGERPLIIYALRHMCSTCYAVKQIRLNMKSSVLVNMQRLQLSNVSLDSVGVIQLADGAVARQRCNPCPCFDTLRKHLPAKLC